MPGVLADDGSYDTARLESRACGSPTVPKFAHRTSTPGSARTGFSTSLRSGSARPLTTDNRVLRGRRAPAGAGLVFPIHPMQHDAGSSPIASHRRINCRPAVRPHPGGNGGRRLRPRCLANRSGVDFVLLSRSALPAKFTAPISAPLSSTRPPTRDSLLPINMSHQQPRLRPATAPHADALRAACRGDMVVSQQLARNSFRPGP